MSTYPLARTPVHAPPLVSACALPHHQQGQWVGIQRWRNNQWHTAIGYVTGHDADGRTITICTNTETITSSCGPVWAAKGDQ